MSIRSQRHTTYVCLKTNISEGVVHLEQLRSQGNTLVYFSTDRRVWEQWLQGRGNIKSLVNILAHVRCLWTCSSNKPTSLCKKLKTMKTEQVLSLWADCQGPLLENEHQAKFLTVALGKPRIYLILKNILVLFGYRGEERYNSLEKKLWDLICYDHSYWKVYLKQHFFLTRRKMWRGSRKQTGVYMAW